MAKIMLVEDDKSLREIYSIRLVAEGYEVVSAGDGEEALAIAVHERPDLIVSDVMMPKISGFDMLDILRSTPETKDIKVIMMTALSSEDQRQRGESLGADKYLVKSQVGIEDVINAVHEVLGDQPTQTEDAATATAPAGAAASTAPAAAASTTPAAAPAVDAAVQPVAGQQPAQVTQAVQTTQTAQSTQPSQAQSPAGTAMDQLLNSTPDTNATAWPGNQAA